LAKKIKDLEGDTDLERAYSEHSESKRNGMEMKDT
jgi:hypothetical protein